LFSTLTVRTPGDHPGAEAMMAASRESAPPDSVTAKSKKAVVSPPGMITKAGTATPEGLSEKRSTRNWATKLTAYLSGSTKTKRYSTF
jgi:hypothetical protein